MNPRETHTVSVSGRATLRLPPCQLILVGRVEVVGETLQLALGESEQRKEATRQWLKRLGCEEVEFGSPRFPDQVEPNAMSSARRHMAIAGVMSQLAGQEPEPDLNHRSVVYVYTACWNIQGKSSEDVLVLADRIRFELSDDVSETGNETEAKRNPFTDPDYPVSEMLAQLQARSEPKEDDNYQVFLAKLTDADYRQLLEAAYDDALDKAVVAAEVVRQSLGAVCGFHILQDPLTREVTKNFYRDHAAPILSESPLMPGPGEQISECPREMAFELQASITFEME